MLFAKIVNLECGYDNGEILKNRGYQLGHVFEVKAIAMGASHTTITMANDERYNSVHFDFFLDKECTKEHDIYNDPLYNPYVRG